MNNASLFEIEHPETRAKLSGYQEVADDCGNQVLKLHTDMEQKKGVVAAARMIAERIMAERQPIQNDVDKEAIEPEEAKIRINQIEKIAAIVREIEENNRNDLVVIRGRIEGVQLAADTVEKRFKSEVMKYERHKRMEEEEDDLHAAPEEAGEPQEAQPQSDEEELDGGNGKNPPRKGKGKKKKGK